MKNSITFLMLVFCTSIFAQSPWTKKKGEVYTQLSYTAIANYTSLFGNPDYDTEREVTDNTVQLYGEYGITDKTTLLVNLPIKLLKTGSLTTESNSFITTEESKSTLGNIELGVKHNFYNKKWLVSGQVNIEANTGSYEEDSGIRSGYDAWTVTPLLSVGRGFDGLFVQGFVGANFRTNEYSSNFKIGAEVGKKMLKRFWLIGFVDIVKSLENGDVILPVPNWATGLYVNDQEYGAYGLKVIGEITPKMGALAGFGGAFFGNNVAKKAAVNIGVYYKM